RAVAGKKRAGEQNPAGGEAWVRATGMSSSTTSGQGDDAPGLVCVVDCVHGMVDALSCVRWNKHQRARWWSCRSTASWSPWRRAAASRPRYTSRPSCLPSTTTGRRGVHGSASAWGSSSTASTCLPSQGSPPLSRSGTLAPTCSFSSGQWGLQMHVYMQKSEPEFLILSPGITILSMQGILQSLLLLSLPS
uniref:Uncharacterized protein n=1 Tax=Aegilops tauschii subsp. strangulata TaxID=200361 RepID=A0A453QJG3_AEGTS